MVREPLTVRSWGSATLPVLTTVGCLSLSTSSLTTEREAILLPFPLVRDMGGRGPSQHEDQQELSRPVAYSASAQRAQRSGGQSKQPVKQAQVAAASQRKAQRSGDQIQQPVKKDCVVDYKKQRRVAHFKKNDRVVVYTKNGAAVHGRVRWTGRYRHPKFEGAFVVGIKTVRWCVV